MFSFKKKTRLEDKVIDIQNGNTELLDEVIREYKPFVKKTVSAVCKRYITESDDEYSIGLIAFSEAIHLYNPTKGQSVLALADTIIKRKVIDYLRQQGRSTIATVSQESDSTYQQADNFQSMNEFHIAKEQELRKEQLVAYGTELSKFDLTFEELVRKSPKHSDARDNAIEIAKIIAEDEELWAYCVEHRRLPLKKLESKVRVSRKTMERNRKYILAVAIIFVKKYSFLMEYVKGRTNSD